MSPFLSAKNKRGLLLMILHLSFDKTDSGGFFVNFEQTNGLTGLAGISWVLFLGRVLFLTRVAFLRGWGLLWVVFGAVLWGWLFFS